MSWGQDKMMGGVRKGETANEAAARQRRENASGINTAGVTTGRFSAQGENKSQIPQKINK